MSNKTIECIFNNSINGVLAIAARIASDFWLDHLTLDSNYKFELSNINIFENTIARAYQDIQGNNESWKIEFNNAFIKEYSKDTDKGENRMVGTMIHEIAHILGVGGAEWIDFFDDSGLIKDEHADKHKLFKGLTVGHDGIHWHEKVMGDEVLTELGDDIKFIMPVTVQIMDLLSGIKVRNKLRFRAYISDIITLYKN